jgi:membrane associated rhomboid family serine protease
MQFPWHSPHKPARHSTGSWPPTATQWLLGVTALSLVTQWFLRSYAAGADGLLRATAALSVGGLGAGRCWQPVTYLFLSDGPWVNFGALLALYLAAGNLEFIIGRRHVFQLYFLAGVLGGLGQLAYDAPAASAVALAGPTSAVMGVVLALTSVMPNLELAPLLGFPLPFWLKIKHCALAAVVGCAVLAVADPAGVFAQEQAARCLVGGLTGCVYMRWLGFGRRKRAGTDSPEDEPMLQIPVFSQAAEASEPKEAATAIPRFTERERRMTPRQYISEQIDPILDKISLHGIGCLTAAERRVLEKGRDKIAQRDS